MRLSGSTDIPARTLLTDQTTRSASLAFRCVASRRKRIRRGNEQPVADFSLRSQRSVIRVIKSPGWPNEACPWPRRHLASAGVFIPRAASGGPELSDVGGGFLELSLSAAISMTYYQRALRFWARPFLGGWVPNGIPTVCSANYRLGSGVGPHHCLDRTCRLRNSRIGRASTIGRHPHRA
jgi:hypothetical protein